jgi:glycosidase
LVEAQSRDNTRSPMQWTDADQAGFTDGEPWTAVNSNSNEINVAAARDDPDSVWHYYRDLIDLRADSDALVYGDFERHESVPDEVFAYTRIHGDERLLVVTNLSDGPETVSVDASEGEPIVSNYADPPPLTDSTLEMRPYEAVVYHGLRY